MVNEQIFCSKYETGQCGIKKQGYDCGGFIRKNNDKNNYYCVVKGRADVFICETSKSLTLLEAKVE